MKVVSIFGTRPEAIKLAPVVLALQADPSIQHVTCVSGQHRQMLDQVLQLFGLKPEYDLEVMRPGQDLVHVTQAVLGGVASVLDAERPDWVIVQGDTTTAFAAALAAFYGKVKVGHVEAGLRTQNRFSPWPEEINRRLISPLSDLHFAPTKQAAENLMRESVLKSQIVVTGNTVIDALHWTAQHGAGEAALNAVLQHYAPALTTETRRLILVTLHRRENHGERLHDICAGLRAVAQRGDVGIVFPVHMNPAVQSVVQTELSGVAGVYLLPPLDYLPFVTLLRRCHFAVTDSGGIQEEAPGLGKPVLVARDTTERPEAIHAGTALLAGTSGKEIAAECYHLLDDAAHYARMASAINPFGDGRAAQRIVARLKHEYAVAKELPQ